MDLLDNPIWHALAGPQSTVAEGTPPALRYDPAVAPFSAIENESPAAWAALGEILGPGELAILFGPDGTAGAGWRELARVPCVQMVATGVETATAAGAVELGDADVSDMVDLVVRTEPGPFLARTIELGTYLGVRDGGALVAMAGERLHLPGYTEISAVCTDAAHRGRGLASALVRDLVGRIRDRGEVAMLHAMADNVNAIRLYAAMGFTVRATFDVRVLGRHA